jgi:phosphopantothenoylcysteine synthetase/decarboxylase
VSGHPVTSTPLTLGLVGSASGGVEHLRAELVEPLIADGWQVAVTLTPTAGTWLRSTGETAALERLTGYPVRVESRLPAEKSGHPPVSCYAVVPASANTVAKLALGLADNQALTTLCEAIGTRNLPVIVFPRINAAHARQPAWSSHIEALRRAGVDLVYGDDVWPLHEPRSAPGRALPWELIRRQIKAAAMR